MIFEAGQSLLFSLRSNLKIQEEGKEQRGEEVIMQTVQKMPKPRKITNKGILVSLKSFAERFSAQPLPLWDGHWTSDVGLFFLF